MRISPEKAVVVIFACLALHNWLIKLKEDTNSNKNTQRLGNGILPFCSQNNSDDLQAIEMRDTIKLFVNNEGARSWQLDKI